MSERLEHVHFVGIGGSGMSAIAKVLVEMGYEVSGSDIHEHEITKQLQTQGVKFYSGHRAENIAGAEMVVYSTGIPQDNVELRTAHEREIPLFHRSQVLAQLLNQKEGIAVTGAHGKTTTSSMVSCMMIQAGIDPTFLIGGEVLDFGFNARAGKGEYVIAEADESDGSFLKYYPQYAIITNIEADHLENYQGNFEKLKEAYVQFIHQIKPNGSLIICLDDPINKEILERLDVRQIIQQNRICVTSYGIESTAATIKAEQVHLLNRSSEFTVTMNQIPHGKITLSIPGRHNILNALACISLGIKTGIPFQNMEQSLTKFVGAKRRFQIVSEANNIIIVDDYAHHPTEIMATIDAAKSTGRKIFAVFQPQRYTRTYFLLDAFSFAFKEADHVLIADIYSPAGEKPIEGVSGLELAERIRRNSNHKVQYFQHKQFIFNNLIQHVRSGDLILTMGAGDIWRLAYQLRDYYQKIEKEAE